MPEKTLGILELEDRPGTSPRGLSVAETHPYPIRRLTVRGATVQSVVGGDRSIANAYIEGARQLENEGVCAIISNCGFSALFQAEVAAAVSVPVALSSLVLVPLVAATVPRGRKVGLLSFDAEQLHEGHYAASGWSSRDLPVCIAGIEGSESWRAIRAAVPDPSFGLEVFARDVKQAVKSLLDAHPDVAALVFECAGFTAITEAVRRETGLPVIDFVSLAMILMEMTPARAVNAAH